MGASAEQGRAWREAELRAWGAWWASDAGVIEVVGVPGVGKSWLVREAAAALSAQGAAEVIWLEVCEGEGVAEVLGRLATTLGWRRDGVSPDALIEALGEEIARRVDTTAGAALVVWDDAELLAPDALAELVMRWPTRARSRLCVISRRALDAGVIEARGGVSLRCAPLADEDGVVMFRACLDARAEAMPPSAEVRALVEALGSLPLALELAAARVRVLGWLEVSRGLDEQLVWLRGEQARGGSLKAALGSIWQALDAPERTLWMALAPRASGWDVAQAMATLGWSRAQVWDALERLSAWSLVRQRVVDGLARVHLLESVRAFGVERAQAEVDEDTRARWEARWRAWALETAAAHASRGWWYDDPEALAWLSRERVELERLAAEGEVAACWAIFALVHRRGGARAQLLQAWEAAQGLPWPAAWAAPWAELMWVAARVIWRSRSREEAVQALDAAVRAWPGGEGVTHDLWVLLRSELAYRMTLLGDGERAEPILAEAYATPVHDEAIAAQVMLNRALVYIDTGRQIDEAQALLWRILATQRQLSQPGQLAGSLSFAGMLALNRREPDVADQCFAEASALYAQLGDEPSLARVQAFRAFHLLGTRGHDESLAIALETLPVLRRVGDPMAEANVLSICGALCARHDPAQAEAHLTRARVLYRELGNSAREREAERWGSLVSWRCREIERAWSRLSALLDDLSTEGDGPVALMVWAQAEAFATRVAPDEAPAYAARWREHAASTSNPASQVAIAQAWGLYAAALRGEADEAAHAYLVEHLHLEQRGPLPELEAALILAEVWRVTTPAARFRAQIEVLARDDVGAGVVGVGLDAQEIRAPDGRWVDLSRRHIVWRVLETLRAHEQAHPGAWISALELAERVWPDEASGDPLGITNRLYHNVGQLKRLGLAELVLSSREGYRLLDAPRWCAQDDPSLPAPQWAVRG